MQLDIAAVFVDLVPSQEKSNSDLLAFFRIRDEEAFPQLVRRYRNRIFNLAWQLLGNKDEVEDVA